MYRRHPIYRRPHGYHHRHLHHPYYSSSYYSPVDDWYYSGLYDNPYLYSRPYFW